jgi:hypothetical protein
MHTANTDHVEALRASEKFRNWGKPRLNGLEQSNISRAEERHFTPDELGALWGVAPQTIRNLFEQEPDVLRIPSQRPGKSARKYVSLKIPHSVAERVHKRYSAVPQ